MAPNHAGDRGEKPNQPGSGESPGDPHLILQPKELPRDEDEDDPTAEREYRQYRGAGGGLDPVIDEVLHQGPVRG